MKENNYKLICLFGKSGSGKDTIQKWLVSNYGMNGIISCTTRPPRDYEQDGVDYHFLTNEEFANKVLDMSMLEATDFNHWFYGTPIEALEKDKINVGVFNIQGIECLLQDARLNIVPIYINCNDKVRLLRNLNREKNPDCKEICRRFMTDDKDFENISFDYTIFTNNDNRDRGFYGLLNLPTVKELIGRN
jgi:guanylate kinase